jgi:hypothetical protein
MMLRRILCLIGPLLLSGCFGYYRPLQQTGLVGHEVLMTLTDSGSVVLARQLGPSITEVSGRIAADTQGEYAVAVASVRARNGLETDWKGEHVAIPHPLVAQIAERRFSRGRTTLFGAAVGVALFAARQAFLGPGGGFGGSTPAGPATGK